MSVWVFPFRRLNWGVVGGVCVVDLFCVDFNCFVRLFSSNWNGPPLLSTKRERECVCVCVVYDCKLNSELSVGQSHV
jgi:hypothetical protein